MNKLIQFFLLIFLVAIGSNNYGQNPYLGVKVGANFSHMLLKDNDGKFTKAFNFAPGFNAGLTMDYRIIPGVTLNTSLLVTTKGYQEKTKEIFQGVEIKSTERLTFYYLELPLQLRYEFEIGMFDFFTGGGPFVSYSYWAKKHWRREGGGEIEWGKEDVYLGTDPKLDDYKNFEYGINICFGGKIENYLLELGYNFSIPNIATKTDYGQVARNGMLYVSASWYFSKFYKYGEGRF